MRAIVSGLRLTIHLGLFGASLIFRQYLRKGIAWFHRNKIHRRLEMDGPLMQMLTHSFNQPLGQICSVLLPQVNRCFIEAIRSG